MEHTTAKHVEGAHATNYERHAQVGPKVDCWSWTGAFDRHGYGRSRASSSTGAHRIGFILFRGDIPAGMVLDHLCRNRGCVNPWHLEVVTNAENTLRQRRSGVCRSGQHEMTPANTYVLKNGKHQRCRACLAEVNRKAGAAFRARRKAALAA